MCFDVKFLEKVQTILNELKSKKIKHLQDELQYCES